MKYAVRDYDPSLPLDYAEEPYGTAYHGVWRQDVETEGKKRTIVTFMPEDYFPYQRCVIVYAPTGVTAEEFAQKSAWIPYAEKHSLALVFLAADKKWGKQADEFEFTAKACDQVFHTVGVISFDHKYAVGYGSSADLLAKMLLEKSLMFAGAALFGPSDLSKAAVKKATDDRRIPVWVINEKGDETPVLTDYFKARNRCLDEGLKNAFAKVCNESVRTTEEPWASDPCSRVWVSEAKDAAALYANKGWTARVFEEFLSKRYHHDHLSITQLKVDYSLEEIGAKVYEKWMPHASFDKPQKRLWAIYAPSDYDPEKAYPLVVVSHGFQCTYEYMLKNTEFWKIAEQRKFIAVFTQGLPHEVTNYGLPRWRSDGHGVMRFLGRKPDDRACYDSEIAYFRAVVKDVEKRYHVDESRIYCTGHSNGAAMTYALSMEMGDVFAASAQVGGAVPQFDSVKKMPKDHYRMPALSVMCEHDFVTDPDDQEKPLYKELLWRKVENGVKLTQEPFIVDNGYTVTHTWVNAEAIPVVKYTLYKDSIHSCHTGIAYYVWDEFLCGYSKDAEGNRYYGGKKIR